MDFEDLVTALEPPPNRAGKSDGLHEHHLYEGAVMLAYAMHLLRTQGARDVRIHPDGEHGKQFDFAGWLLRREFAKISNLGTTSYGGVYRNAAGQTITVNPKSGLGDVVAEVGVPWVYMIDSDIFVRPSSPLSPDTLSCEDRVYDDGYGGTYEEERPVELYLEEVARTELSAWDQSRWATIEQAKQSVLFETPIPHFLVRAFLAERG